jgi:2-polyprenyl-3-methyl-5-hydroxy-6-metoxy-1,4-benzoquinol methylase
MRALLRVLATDPPRSLVDLGCGSGLLLEEVQRRFPDASLAGVDLSPRQIEANRARFPSIDWSVSDLGRSLDEPQRRYHVVVASEVIEHVDDPAALLSNARRFTEPGGRLLLSTQSGPVRATETFVGHRRHFSTAEMSELLERSGWSPERVWSYGWPFHDLSKWFANRDPERTLARFGGRAYGWWERLWCLLLRTLFRFNSHRRGAQLFAVARNEPPGEPSARSPDLATASAFADSWNHLGAGSAYTREQFLEWMQPLDPDSFEGEEVLELGFGNGSLLVHLADYGPRRLAGIELGDTLESARHNLAHVPPGVLELHRGDLTRARLGRFDFVYCIGVLHHLSDPRAGFDSVLRHTRPGGRFHCWVYGREGNGLVIYLVDPLRRVTCRLPWWLTKYGIALPLAIPFFVYAKLVARLAAGHGPTGALAGRAPLSAYCRWIARRGFPFFHHVAFDQLVTPRTRYMAREEVEEWLHDPRVDPPSTYVRFRNGNSWAFGGRRAAAPGETREIPR